MWMFSLYPCRFSPDTPVPWFGGEQKMERRAPAHCCCVPGSLTSFSSTSPQVLLLFFQLPASTSGLQPTNACAARRGHTHAKPWWLSDWIYLKVQTKQQQQQQQTKKNSVWQQNLFKSYLYKSFLAMFTGVFFKPYLPDFISVIHAYEVI